MSINETERRRTADELAVLRGLLPVEDDVLAQRLGYDLDRFVDVLALRPGVDPLEVWRVRDFLLAVAAAHGIRAPGFSVLKQSRRAQAQRWFGTWEVPETDGL